MNAKDQQAIERLDQVFLASFETNHPAMLDWVRVRMLLNRTEREWEARLFIALQEITACTSKEEVKQLLAAMAALEKAGANAEEVRRSRAALQAMLQYYEAHPAPVSTIGASASDVGG